MSFLDAYPCQKAFATLSSHTLPRVDEIRVIVRRGDVVEATHLVHAVAVRDGAVIEQAGEAQRVAYLRSSAKPFQALPLVRARDDLTTEEIAIASASHLASPEQLAAVRSLLAKAPAGEDELECGAEPTPLQHNCSGKHAGMLALCRAQGWASGGYRLATHPVQHACLAEIASASDVPADEIPTAVDGCGVVTFALPLERMALLFSRLEQVDGGATGGCRDARAPGADPRADGRRLAADARARGLDGEGRGRGPDVRGRAGRARDRAQGRGREHARDAALPSPSSSAGSASRPASWGSSRSRTHAASSSARW